MITRNENNLLAAYWSGRSKSSKKSRVPAGYVEADVLGDMHQTLLGIDSGLLVTNQDEWEVTCKAENNNAGNLCVMGGGQSKTDSNAGLWLNAKTSEVEFIFGNGGDSNYKVFIQNFDVTQWHTYKMNLSTGEAWIDGVYQGTAVSKSSFPKQRKLMLFACWREVNNNVVSNTFYGKVKEYIIRRNGSVIAHFIPCKCYIDTETTGVYELCNGVYTNLPYSFCLFSFHAEWSVTVEAGYQYNCYVWLYKDSMDVDWGDGTTETLTTATINQAVSFSHTYANAGTYSLSLDAPYASDTLGLGTISNTASNAKTIASVTKLESRIVPKNFCRGASNATIGYSILKDKYYIGDYAFDSCATQFKELPESITSFGMNAFAWDRSIFWTCLPSNTVFIGTNCFYGCTNLALTSFPSGLTTIKNGSFRGCGNIVASSLPSGITSIGDYGFYQCLKLSLTELPSGLTTIGQQAFNRCYSMTLSSLPNLLTSIGDKGFSGCSRITISTLPPLVTRISNYLFQSCTGITSFTIPNSITQIGEYAFSGCTNMQLSALPTNLISLGQCAFENCSQISVSSTPSTLTTLALYVFRNCTSMLTFTFGAVMESVSVSSFNGCTNLADIYCPWYEGDVDNAPWSAVNATVHYLENGSSSSSSEEESSSSSGVSYESSLLPAGYIDADGFYVEYQTSKPYLDTGLNQDAGDVWEVKYAAPSNYTNNVPLIGSGASKTNGNCCIWVNNQTNEIQFIFGSGSDESYIIRTSISNTRDWHVYKMKISTGEAWIDGTYLGTAGNVGTISNAKKIVLLGCWRNTSNFNASHGVIGYCKITRNNTLVRHFVPFYRWTDGVSGLYDLCDGAPHTMSNSTGEAVYAFNAKVKLPVEASYQHEIGLNPVIGNTANVTWGDRTMTSVSGVGDIVINHTYSNAETCQLAVEGSFMRYVSLTNGGSKWSNITQFIEYNGKKVPHSLLQGATNATASDNVLGSLYAVDENAFKNCSSLAWTVLPDVIKYIGASAFEGCTSLALTELPNALEYIGSGAFSGCTSLALATFPTGVLSIGGYAFINCRNISFTSLPNSITTLGDGTFNGCTNLALTSLPSSLTYIGAHAFKNCSNITITSIPNSVTQILEEAFENCTQVSLSSLPSGLTIIKHRTFMGCALTLTSLPSGITTIGESAFSGCTNLALTSLPSGLTNLGGYAFINCRNIVLTSIPNGITSIYDGTFNTCTSLALTSLPSGLTYIGSHAFKNCTSLALTSLPSGLTTISEEAFQNCSSLALTSLPSGITVINKNTFAGCTNLAITQIPSGVTSIGENAFGGCSSLTSLTFLGTPTTISSNAFGGCTNLTTINVPWSSGDVSGAPWGATNATINYNYSV